MARTKGKGAEQSGIKKGDCFGQAYVVNVLSEQRLSLEFFWVDEVAVMVEGG